MRISHEDEHSIAHRLDRKPPSTLHEQTPDPTTNKHRPTALSLRTHDLTSLTVTRLNGVPATAVVQTNT